jgi:hypothetical protein
MSGLQVSYSKEIAKELNQFAICPPGFPVAVGDVLHFPFGRGGLFGTKARPWGGFEKITDLNSLGVTTTPPQEDVEPDPYIYASRGSVGIQFHATATAGNNSGTINAEFRKEGSVYLAAVDCRTQRLQDITQIEIDLQKHDRDVIWKDTFLVVSITKAAKALLMQSSSSMGSFEASGTVKGLVPGSDSKNINASTSIKIESFKDACFFKPWSDNVAVFFGLMRFEKRQFGHPFAATSRFAFDLLNSKGDQYKLVAMSPKHFLETTDEV